MLLLGVFHNSERDALPLKSASAGHPFRICATLVALQLLPTSGLTCRPGTFPRRASCAALRAAALQRVVRSQTTPVLAREPVVVQRLFDAGGHDRCGIGQLHLPELARVAL